MKTVVFVCLLSLSLSLSQSAAVTGTESSQGAPADIHPTQTGKVETKPTEQQSPGKPEAAGAGKIEEAKASPANKPEIKPNETQPATNPPTTPTKDANKTPEKSVTNDTKPAPEKSKEAPKDGSNPVPDNKSKGTPANETKTPSEAGAPVTTKPTDKNEEMKPGNATTMNPKMEVTTKAPADTTAAPHVGKRGFDGASFIGGIILTLGLLAIGFMGFKYYKNQTERNYHTL